MTIQPINQQSLFEQIYTYAPIGIALVSIDGNFLKVNPALCKILDYSTEELLQLSFQSITHPEDLQRDNDILRQFLEGRSLPYETEKRYIQKNGNVIWISLHAAVIRDDNQVNPLYFISHISDISAKKAAEQKLLESEELYKLISENAQDIISYSTPDGILRYCSPAIRDLLGYEVDELVGKTNLDFYHPDDLKDMLSRTYQDHDVLTCRVRHKNGHYVWFETTFKIIRNEDGDIQKILGIGRDITERKKHEDNLAEAQRIAAMGSWEWDIVTNKMIFSDQMFRIYDQDKKDFINDTSELIKLVHPSDQDRLWEGIIRAKAGQELNMEFRHIQQDGSIKHLHVRGKTFFDGDGRPVRMTGTVQEITEQKNIELKLQETIERYTSLKKYNHDAVFSLDLEGCIINANHMAQQLTGTCVQEMAGKDFSRFIVGGHIKSILQKSTTDASIENSIDKIKHKEGHTADVLTTIVPIIINSENVGYYIISKDITEQRKLLIAKEAAETTNKAKSEFLAVMSHEIRTPMNGVIGMTDLLLETTNLDAQQREYVEIISKSGETLLAIINDILDFSKIESGRTELQDEPLGVRDCIAEAFDILSPKADKKQLVMSYYVNDNVPPVVIGDADRLKQVLLNLISNAIKFTPSGSVSVTVSTLSRQFQSLYLKFVVRDSGIGIPDSKKDQLFQPFSQVDNFMTRKSDGTGLGLAISKKLVDLMDGEIWIEDSEEPGATFIFTVCVKEFRFFESSMDEVRSKQEELSVQKPLHVLIAEDNEINQIVLTRMLEKLGHSIDIVEDGNEVIRAVAYKNYDIIFMDIHMPGMNGLDTTQIIKKSVPADQCPVIIAVTANALNEDRETCLAAGMDDYISKPIKSEMVMESIGRFFS